MLFQKICIMHQYNVCIGNHTVSSSIWKPFAWVSFSKSWNCMSRFGECNFAFWKTHKCKLIPNWMRKTIWLPINDTHEKICVMDVWNFTDSELSSQFCVRAKPQVILIIMQSRKKCAIIEPSRACAWFENKRFDWLSVNFFVHWPIRMLALLPFLHSITSFLHCVKETLHCSRPIRIK